jgi:hypothetical protein
MATSKFGREPRMMTTEPSVDEVKSLKRGGKASRYAKGGMIESAAHERKEEREIKSVKKELSKHEHEKASKAHHGLKAGGKAGAAIDSFEARSALKPKVNVKDKVVSAKQVKSLSTKTTGVEGKGYKKGGEVSDSVASRYKNTLMHDNPKAATKKLGTGEIKQKPAGYKDGGHVAMTCKSMGGFTVNKKMCKGGY